MTKEVKTGMMAFIVLVAAMAVFLFVRPKDWFDGNYFRMTASFSSVQGIKKGNEVRYAGVRVGEVSKISTEGNEGILEMLSLIHISEPTRLRRIGPSGSDDGKSEEADGFRSADEREYREDGRKVGS